ncbi:CapA family protein [Phascolarctobacterium sp.]
MFKCIIGADIVPTESNIDLFINADINTLIGNDIKNILENADFIIFNLEVPLTDKYMPIRKCGPNLIAPTKTIAGLKAINPHFFTLANNHILDQGEQGLKSTIDLLDEHGIAFAGAGKDLEEASKPYIFENEGKKIGIYCCAEHEFTIATENTSGANPFDPLNSLDHVMELKKQCDYVIVLYHGGKEHYRYPSPYLQKVCRKLVDKGADIVVCQHSHCIGCEEKWHGGTIVYGQGNFLFDDGDNEFWNTSVLLEVTIDKNLEVNYLPLCKKSNMIRLAEKATAEDIGKQFVERSNRIKSAKFVQDNYAKFAEAMSREYFFRVSGRISKFLPIRIINKLTNYRLLKYLYGQKEITVIENCLECEAHRELFVQFLQDCRKGRD